MGTETHGSDGLDPSKYHYTGYAGKGCRIKDGWMNGPILVGWCTEHDLAATGYPGRNGQHQDGGEERCGSSRDVDPHFLDGPCLTPANHTGGGLHFQGLLLLRKVELLDIPFCKADS